MSPEPVPTKRAPRQTTRPGKGFAELKSERLRAVGEAIWGYPVDGVMLPEGRNTENLWERIARSALDHFEQERIGWWRSNRYDGSTPGPTRLLRSSQVACVNHLWSAREDEELALQIAKNVLPSSAAVVEVDRGLVAFEWIGNGSYLGERGARTRGANVTSLDAFMIVRTVDGQRRALAFEWKYTELPGSGSQLVSKKGTPRLHTYRPLLERKDCPVVVDDLEDLFYDPFLQLTRQTLLAWQLCEREEVADDWIHISIVPTGNQGMRARVGPPGLTGRDMADAWRSALSDPGRYRCMTPSELIAGTADNPGWGDWRRYLAVRYAS